MKYFIILSVLFCFISNSLAGGWLQSNKKYKVEVIYIENGTDASCFHFKVTEPPSANDVFQVTGVTPTTPEYFRIDASNQRGKDILAALFLAKSTGASFCVYIDGVISGRPVCTGIALY